MRLVLLLVLTLMLLPLLKADCRRGRSTVLGDSARSITTADAGTLARLHLANAPANVVLDHGDPTLRRVGRLRLEVVASSWRDQFEARGILWIVLDAAR